MPSVNIFPVKYLNKANILINCAIQYVQAGPENGAPHTYTHKDDYACMYVYTYVFSAEYFH